MNDIIEIAATLASSCIYLRLCNGFLGLKDHKFKLLKSVGFVLLQLIIDPAIVKLEIIDDISGYLSMIIILVYSFWFLKGKIWEKLLVSVIPALIQLPLSMISINIFGSLAGNNRAEALPGGSMRFYVLVFAQFVFCIVCEIIIKVKKKQAYSLNKFQQVIQLSCFFISFIIAALLWNFTKERSESSLLVAVVFLLIMFLNVLLYILMSKMQKDNVTKEEYNLLKASLSAQEKLAVEVRERYTEMKTLRHDMKHYFTAAAELISDGKPNEAKKYIESVINEKINSTTTVINTGSAVIDAAINNKIAVCSKKGIEIKCMIDTQFSGINDMDISILFSNLLDNAINGCDISEPKIELVIKSKKSFTYINVKNKIGTSVLDCNPYLLTKKEDKNEHGFGIKSIKNIAKKYDGSAEFSEQNGYFIAEVWLKNTENL
ncbi:MAG: GHKL domain-containing protein [Ruminococcaceae bacterium]|nr:GHKL domain-containing protein [Oscillospiraceae bacterium]